MRTTEDFKNLTKEQMKEIYDGLRNGTREKADDASLEEHQLAVKIANQLSDSDFYKFLTTGDMPLLKLSQSELGLMRGGRGQVGIKGVEVGVKVKVGKS